MKKRLISLFLLVCMMIPLVAALNLTAGASEQRFTVTNSDGSATTTFEYGEPIMVTPLSGSGTDWIGIAKKGEVSSGAVRYKYITDTGAAAAGDNRVGSMGLGLNKAFDIRTGATSDEKFDISDIGVGNWTIFRVANNGKASNYEISSAIDITVTAGAMSVNKKVFRVGEPIMVTAEKRTNNSWYGIVPCDDDGTPKKNFGTMVYRHADGTADDLRNTKSDTARTGTFGDAKRLECAVWMNSADRAIDWGEVSNKHLASLPAGVYWLVYCLDSTTIYNGSGVTHAIQIRIDPCIEAAPSYAYGAPIELEVYTPADNCYVFIAPKHEDINSNYWSIRWQTVETAGSSTFDMRESRTTGNYPHLWQLPPGEYSLYMVFAPDTKATAANHASRVNITICDDKPLAPVAATYKFDKMTAQAGGTLTVKLDESGLENTYNRATHILTYWGDAKGNKLDGYTYISTRKVTGAVTMITIPAAVVIPDEAKSLLVYTYNGAGASEDCFCVELPEERRVLSDKDKGELLSSFQIVSDIHAQDSLDNYYNKNIAQMLADIKAVDPNSAGVFVAGDAVNDGREAEYQNLYTLYKQSGLEAPFFFVSGNHEWKLGDSANSYTSNYEEEKNRYITHLNKFLSDAGEDTITNGLPYYDLWINGFHYIFLASEAAITHAYLSDAQLEWFEEKLAEDRDAKRPTFVIIHQGLYDTIDGCMERDEWDGIIAGDDAYKRWKNSGKWNTKGKYEQAFRDILKKYPEAMMFSGHTHRDMTELYNYYDPTATASTLPNYLFNTAAVAYVSTGFYDDGVTVSFAESWHDQTYTLYGETKQKWDSSKGYYVRVYENCVEIYGREFSTAEWVPNAMYRIVTADHIHTGELSCSNTCKYCGQSITPVVAHTGEYDCSVLCKYGCGGKITPKAEHSFGEWEIVSEATSSKQGEKTRTCSVCGYIEGQKIPVVASKKDNAKTEDSTALVVGIIIGAVVLLVGAGGAAFMIVKKKRK